MNQNELFIGRTNIIKNLEEEVFFPFEGDFGSCMSICGPHGIGKTYLIHHLLKKFDDAKEKGVCVYMPVEFHSSGSDPLLEFKKNLLSHFADLLPLDSLKKNVDDFQGPPSQARKLRNSLRLLEKAYSKIGPDELCNPGDPQYTWWRTEVIKCFEANTPTSIFLNYTQLGYHIILILDEFDRSSNHFPDGDIYQWLFSLSDKSGSGMNLNLSIVTLSRRRPSLFVKSMDDGSDFESAFPVTILRGFSNEELFGAGGYFDSFGPELSASLTPEIKQRILYYCGRHPDLLMRMRKSILQQDHTELDIDELWAQNAAFERVYQKMCAQMRMPDSSDITLIDAFMYQFIYFAGGEENSALQDDRKQYRDKLVDAGFASEAKSGPAFSSEKNCDPYEDIFVLSGEKEKNLESSPLICEPISPFFLNYIEHQWKPERSKGAAQHLGCTERELRLYLEEKLKTRYHDDWIHAIEIALNPDRNNSNPNIQKMKKFMGSLKKLAQRNHYTQELSNMDVLSFFDYYKIIETYWSDMFQADFMNYPIARGDVLNALYNDFIFLCGCRNAKAHENLKILSAESINRVQQICGSLDEIISLRH